MATTSSAAFAKPTRRSIAGLIVVLLLVIVALAVGDSVLERAEQADLRKQAERAYDKGERLFRQGKADESVDFLRKAHSLELGSADYEVELINALIAAGKTAEAEPLMNEILLREPNDGNANLSAAHLMLKEGKNSDAEAHYHRAIYGEWPEDAAKHRLSARLELVGLLAKEDGRRGELLAELLPLQEEGKKDPQVQRSLGSLFLLAGSAARSADVYRKMLEQDPKAAAAYSGLGEAELEMGRYREAHAAFAGAANRAPQDATIGKRLELASNLKELDPTPRQMATMEKYHRSVTILRLVAADLKGCLAERANEQAAQSLTDAEAALNGKMPAHATNELSEGLLGLAEKGWKTRIAACGPKTAKEEEPLRLIMEKLAQ